MSVDLAGKRLCIDEAEVELTAREWLVLECLVRRRRLNRLQGARCSRPWRVPTRTSRRTRWKCMISRLRAKLGAAAVIRSLRGLGYRLEEAKLRVTSSISRQLIFWLAVPLMLVALCGALVHYFNNVAPGGDQQRSALEGSGERLDGACARSRKVGSTLDPAFDGKPVLPARGLDQVRAARHPRAPARRRCAIAGRRHEQRGQPAASPWRRSIGRSVRTLTTRFDSPGWRHHSSRWLISARPTSRRRGYGFMSTLLWDFVQLDITLVLVWVGIQLGLASGQKAARRNRQPLAARSASHRGDLGAAGDRACGGHTESPVWNVAHVGSVAAAIHRQHGSSTCARRSPECRPSSDLLVAEPAAQPVKARLLTLQEGIGNWRILPTSC